MHTLYILSLLRTDYLRIIHRHVLYRGADDNKSNRTHKLFLGIKIYTAIFPQSVTFILIKYRVNRHSLFNLPTNGPQCAVVILGLKLNPLEYSKTQLKVTESKCRVCLFMHSFTVLNECLMHGIVKNTVQSRIQNV